MLATLGKDIDFRKLSRNGQIDHEIWSHALKYNLWSVENDNRFEFDPRCTGSTSPTARHLPSSSHSRLFFHVSTTCRTPRSSIAFIPAFVAAAKEGLTNPPRVLTEIAIKRNLGAIAFYEKELFALARETAATSELTAPAKAAVTALKEYQQFLEGNLKSRSTGDWRIGKEKFAQKLELELDAGITADEVIKVAEAEADRVEREMYYVAKQLWSKLFPGRVLPPDDAEGRRFTTQPVLDELGNDHGKPEAIVDDARQTVEKIKEFITAKKILRLPEPDRCQVIEMPEFQRGFSVAYLNPAPPLDPKAASVYAVSPPPDDWEAAASPTSANTTARCCRS